MAVIKSAIELAMERTKNIVLKEEEKKALAEKEVENRLRAFVRRYLAGITDIDGAKKELDGFDADRNLKKLILIDILIEDFDIKNERLFDLFDMACGDIDEQLKDELEMLKKRFAEQMERKGILIKKEITERLADKGIYGDGFEPNIEAWDEWEKGLKEIKTIFKNRFSEWKEKLKSTKQSAS